MQSRMKNAFTLIELMVVIGIIAILAASLTVAFRGADESGRSAKCRANMRQLAQACYSCAMESDARKYPLAGSCQAYESNGGTSEVKGWLSWLSKGKFDRKGKASQFVQCSMPGVFSPRDDIQHAYTNGAIWKAIDGNSSVFLCPTMINDKKARGRDGATMGWCYVMSARFHFDWSYGSEATESVDGGLSISSLAKPDRTLMFGEICLEDLGGGGTGDRHGDCVLEYGDGNSTLTERIGFPHKTKQGYAGMVAFADGHVESYMKPSGGKSAEQDMTKWLCMSYDVTFESGAYRKIDDSVDDDDDDSDDDE